VASVRAGRSVATDYALEVIADDRMTRLGWR